MSEKKYRTFKNRFLRGALPINLGCAFIIFFFSAFFVMPSPRQFFYTFIVAIILMVMGEITVFQLGNKLNVDPLSDFLEKNARGEINDVKERTELFVRLQKFPIVKAVEAFATYFICSIVFCISHNLIPQVGTRWSTVFITLAACTFGSYNAGLLELTFAETLCNPYLEQIVKDGVDKELITAKKQFGLPMIPRAVIFFAVPVLFANILPILVYLQGEADSVKGFIGTDNLVLSEKAQIIRISIICVISLLICFTLSFLFYLRLKRTNSKLENSITEVLTTGSSDNYASTTVSDRMQFSVYLLNETVARFNEIIQNASETGKKVLSTTDDLSVIAKELSSTSMEQSADVKEILTTMEDTNAFSQNISGRISGVSEGTDNTKDDVETGFDVIKQNSAQMEEISSSNKIITEGIKNLGNQIDNIGNIITMINDIADQTRIIAFNAELEAVSAGSKGHNFHIVATEIRRLANSTVDSVHEIQKYIEGIQEASKKLIASSESETQYITEEMEIAQKLETHFTSIHDSAEETSAKSAEIASIVEQQTSSFNQIVITLRQISSGIESFASSTKTISETAGEMQLIASQLSNLSKSF